MFQLYDYISFTCLLPIVQTIFPRPATPNDLWIKRRDLFGPALPGRNGNDMLYFNVEKLRDYATRAHGFMDLVPA
jgi:hypothetical protein